MGAEGSGRRWLAGVGPRPDAEPSRRRGGGVRNNFKWKKRYFILKPRGEQQYQARDHCLRHFVICFILLLVQLTGYERVLVPKLKVQTWSLNSGGGGHKLPVHLRQVNTGAINRMTLRNADAYPPAKWGPIQNQEAVLCWLGFPDFLTGLYK